MASQFTYFISHPLPLFAAATVLRAAMLLYGLWQDANSPLKYTDIDYLVFTDAARFTFSSAETASPYMRETYRYTPLLAWLLYPTTWSGTFWFSFGKALFAAADLLAGYLIILVLRGPHVRMSADRACRYAGIWLLNPMVATISTRGSSEGLLGVLVMALLWAVLEKRVTLAGVLLGLGVHFKIYPFIYAPAIVWWMDVEQMGRKPEAKGRKEKGIETTDQITDLLKIVVAFTTPERITLTLVSLTTFIGLNLAMYTLYGTPFLTHTFFHHVTRIDHRHNFSPYNILLYLNSAYPSSASFKVESVAFLPQLLLSTIIIPLVGAKKDLPTTMLAQTFAFVTFNKVCTSQYFLWYMVFLPLYLPNSSLLHSPRIGLSALALWLTTQGLWLQQAYNLEFLGLSTFVPGLWIASLAFFLVNSWILGIIIEDLGGRPGQEIKSD
ncbi:glycosyltransferase family 50 protein [Annulohypoxylon maeteangense]|uniref:glycosyltransferase family 50 protein n=1 Tax=Annulohypoxylon maeteangense TaxID=1927788 RepID=UPI002008798B|nr:glycosyltransferase family 50 protein [Annulohypoxylon maeteangense]KAI0881421.1 glycosyltransferase family 50 protein [Annulohypoxylon maeteangense]